MKPFGRLGFFSILLLVSQLIGIVVSILDLEGSIDHDKEGEKASLSLKSRQGLKFSESIPIGSVIPGKPGQNLRLAHLRSKATKGLEDVLVPNEALNSTSALDSLLDAKQGWLLNATGNNQYLLEAALGQVEQTQSQEYADYGVVHGPLGLLFSNAESDPSITATNKTTNNNARANKRRKTTTKPKSRSKLKSKSKSKLKSKRKSDATISPKVKAEGTATAAEYDEQSEPEEDIENESEASPTPTINTHTIGNSTTTTTIPTTATTTTMTPTTTPKTVKSHLNTRSTSDENEGRKKTDNNLAPKRPPQTENEKSSRVVGYNGQDNLAQYVLNRNSKSPMSKPLLPDELPGNEADKIDGGSQVTRRSIQLLQTRPTSRVQNANVTPSLTQEKGGTDLPDSENEIGSYSLETEEDISEEGSPHSKPGPGNKEKEAGQGKEPTETSHQDRHAHLESSDLRKLPQLIPKWGNMTNYKWRESHWEAKWKNESGDGAKGLSGENRTEGNWTKGFRQRALWTGANDTAGTWTKEGIMQGLWSLTREMGRRILEIFWTQHYDGQLNVTIGHNMSSFFENGNWSQGNSTQEVGLVAEKAFIQSVNKLGQN